MTRRDFSKRIAAGHRNEYIFKSETAANQLKNSECYRIELKYLNIIQ